MKNEVKMKTYVVPQKKSWKGRIDSENNRDAFRIHQVIRCIDLTKTNKLAQINTGFCFLGYCCDEGIVRNLGRQGADKGYEAVKKELANLPVSFDENVDLYDGGYVVCKDNNMEKAQAELSIIVEKALQLGLFPVVIGGGHDVAYGSFCGVSNYLTNNKNLGIINFDAHFDLRELKEKGNSGTMFHQISEDCKRNKTLFNYMAVGIQKSGNTISLFKKADSLGVNYFLAKDINLYSLNKIKEQLDNFIKPLDKIYITICLDVFSSAYASGVSAPQPFGLQPETVMSLMKHILDSKKVINFDIAEISPRFDNDNQTAKLAAIFIYALINTVS